LLTADAQTSGVDLFDPTSLSGIGVAVQIGGATQGGVAVGGVSDGVNHFGIAPGGFERDTVVMDDFVLPSGASGEFELHGFAFNSDDQLNLGAALTNGSGSGQHPMADSLNYTLNVFSQNFQTQVIDLLGALQNVTIGAGAYFPGAVSGVPFNNIFDIGDSEI